MHTNMELQTELVTFKANMHEFRSKEKASIERIKALDNALAEDLQEYHSEIKKILSH